MSTTSQKHRNFVAEPMGEKPVTDLAGIGDVLGKRLESKGFDKAYVVLGQFLLLKKNKELFVEWIKVGSRHNETVSQFICAGPGQRQHQAERRLFPVPVRLVRRVPVTSSMTVNMISSTAGFMTNYLSF